MPDHANFRWAATLLLTMIVVPIASAQDDKPRTVDASLAILTPMEIASAAVLDDDAPAKDAVIAWIKPVFKAVESQFAGDKAKRTVVVQITLHPDRAAEVAVAGRPAPSDAEVAAILKVADASKLPKSRLASCVLRVVAEVNGGDPDAKKPLMPPLVMPGERRMSEFRAATTAARLALMQRWARTEAIPLMAHLASRAEPKYQGVRNLGKALKGVKAEGPIDEAAISDRNPDYWRAMMEMAPGNPYVPASRVMLHAANGEIDSARRLARTLAPFDRHKSAHSDLLAEFAAMGDVFFKDVEGRINEGIKLNDAGKLDEAIAAYDGILKDYPRSAWCHYEKHQTLMIKSLKDKGSVPPDWPSARKAILRGDPLYGSMAQASSEDELYDLLLRKESEELFTDKTKSVKDLLRYADIALDLGQPAFAAMIYWNLASNLKPAQYENRDLIESVLYCVEQLGDKTLKENFKGDHAAAFAKIDAERARRKKESVAGRVMKEKSK